MFNVRKRFAPRFMLLSTLVTLLAACGATPTSNTSTGGSTAVAPAAAANTAAATTGSSAKSSGAAVTLTYLVGDDQTTKNMTNAVAAAYTALHPNVTINIETRPGGADGDNLVKTRLATGEMTDLFFYNSGSLLQALKPSATIAEITKEPYIANIQDVFLPAVTQNGQIFGVPTGTAMGGGILYNKKVYQRLGLSVPKSWAEFEANNEKIKAANITPVIASYGTTWTSQLFVLADYYNVQQATPTFAQDYTAHKVTYSANPTAKEGFTYLQEGNQKGWYPKDYATTTFEQGLKMLSDGTGAHYPMLSFALSTIATNSPDKINDIGFFGMPGQDAAKNGATIWLPAATYIAKTSKHIAEAKDFQAFIASTAGVDAISTKVPPAGPYVIKGAKLPDNVLPAVKDIGAYIDSNHSGPALEFLSPVKGPNLEQICVATGSGQMAPQDAAANYDKDVEKQAKQLGLPGW
ncbi:MAG: hypothetical protein NVSMB42_02610 [Herpetosiphon sp.]